MIRSLRSTMTGGALLLAVAGAAVLARAQTAGTASPGAPATPPALTPATPAPPAAPAPPNSPVSSMRSKISAGDLRSAESILESYRERAGEDGNYLVGLSWLARGALLLGEPDAARRYVRDVRARCADSLMRAADLTKSGNLELALGAAIEVEAQLRLPEDGAEEAAAFVRDELTRITGPVALRSRLYKRLNLLSLDGTAAPELVVEDRLAMPVPSLASLRGRPILLFLWAEWCGDCRAQAPNLARLRQRHASSGLQVVALTRYYDDPAKRAAEKARVDSTWTATYGGLGETPVVISTASMERYGGSSTPTYVFIDRRGKVRSYRPVRLTDVAFERELAAILRD